MKDLIERQAAIDAIERNAYRHTYIDQIVDIIKGLPSSQPDIILCPNCRYNDGTAYCELHYRDVKAKDFCSWAERRTDG